MKIITDYLHLIPPSMLNLWKENLLQRLKIAQLQLSCKTAKFLGAISLILLIIILLTKNVQDSINYEKTW